MGCVYRHRNRRTWWIKYKSAGRWQYESSKSSRKEDAKQLLRLREGDSAKGIPITARVNRLRFEEARDDLLNFHTANGRDVKKLKGRIEKHLTPFFAGRKMAEITVPLINDYVTRRRSQVTIIPARTIRRRKSVITIPARVKPVATETINRELAWLKHMFNLAIDAGKLMTKPRIKLLEENNVRQGFLEPDEMRNVLAKLPNDLRAVVEFAYITGWRVKSEVLSLTWSQVDFAAGEVRLEPGTTKNGAGRTFPFTSRLRMLLEGLHKEHQRLKRSGHLEPHVFIRMTAKGRGGPPAPSADQVLY